MSWGRQHTETVKFKRFAKPRFLKSIGAPLLDDFFERFRDELGAHKVPFPEWAFDDDAFFKALSALVMRPDGLPDRLVEALHGIEAMANEEGQERLERAVDDGTLRVTFKHDSSHADIAVQAWMADRMVFARKLNEQRLARLSAFEYFASRSPVDRRQSFSGPDEATMARIRGDIDAWFRRHNRGEETSHIEVFPIDAEFWFLIRHGDTFARMPVAAKNRRVEILHFRPTKDDVVVYSAGRDEIRIHAGTMGERELYRGAFGSRLFGDRGYFCDRMAYTLEPLRLDGMDSLDTRDVPGISRIVLREIEVAWDNSLNDVVIRKCDDVFAAAADRDRGRRAVPQSGRIRRAAFDFYFGDCRKPGKVQIRIPNMLRLGPRCEAGLVHEWISARGLRTSIFQSERIMANEFLAMVGKNS